MSQDAINSSLPGQNGHHFADDIVRCIFVNEKFCIQLRFHWSLFPIEQLTITCTGLENGLVPSHYLNQCWPNSLTHFCGTRGKWVNDKSTLDQEMGCCHQATNHHLNQCWRSSIMPYDVTRDQWVNILTTLFLWIVNTKRGCPPVILEGLITCKSALVQVMAWCWIGNMPLPEPMMVWVT